MLLDENITRLTPDGDLVIDLRPVRDVILKYAPWDSGMYAYRWSGFEWIELGWDQRIPLITQANLMQASSPIAQYARCIPEDVRERAGMFIYNQTTMLQWAARDFHKKDLLISNPALYWLFVHAAETRYWLQEELNEVILLKQQQILNRVTGYGTKSTVRILKKLELQHGDKRELQFVLWFLKRDWFNSRLRNLKKLPVHVLAALYRCPELATTRMVNSLSKILSTDMDVPSALSQADMIRQIWSDTEALGQTLGIGNIKSLIEDCESFEQLQRIHDRWTDILNGRKHSKEDMTLFPLPPVKGTNKIKPIRTEGDLREEGRFMEHCIGGYSNRVISGKSYIYRVFKPERATLEVRINNGTVMIGDMRMQKNKYPSEETTRVVREWLSTHIEKKSNA